MTDSDEAIRQQLTAARTALENVEQQRDQEKADLLSRLSLIDGEYDRRVHGLQKAIEGLREALGETTTKVVSISMVATAPPRVGEPVPIDAKTAVRKVLQGDAGGPYHLDKLTKLVLALGYQTRAKHPRQTIRAAVYALIEDGLPIKRVGEATWAWFGPYESMAEAQAAT